MSSIFFSFIFNRLFIMYYLKICVISYHHKLCTSIHPKSKIFKTRPLSLWLSTIIRLQSVVSIIASWTGRFGQQNDAGNAGRTCIQIRKDLIMERIRTRIRFFPFFIFRNLFADVEWNGCRRRRMGLSGSKKNGQDWDWEWNQGRLRNERVRSCCVCRRRWRCRFISRFVCDMDN